MYEEYLQILNIVLCAQLRINTKFGIENIDILQLAASDDNSCNLNDKPSILSSTIPSIHHHYFHIRLIT